MDNLRLIKTKCTFAINFNAESGILEMEGSSYPENSFEFFQPVTQWVKSYVAEAQKPIVLNIRVQYMNTSSSKCILDIFQVLEECVKAGREAEVNWYYPNDDDELLEAGKEYINDTEIKINIIPY